MVDEGQNGFDNGWRWTINVILVDELVYHGSQWLITMLNDDLEWLMITGLWVMMFMAQNFASQAHQGVSNKQ